MAKTGIPTLGSLRIVRSLLETAVDELSHDSYEHFPMVYEAYLQVKATLPLVEQAIKKHERWEDDWIHTLVKEAVTGEEAMVQAPRKLNDEEVDALAAQVYVILTQTFEQVVGKRGRSTR